MNGQASTTDGRVTSTTHGRVLVIELDRPARRNAMTGRMATELQEALKHFESSPELRVGVLTGAGGYFCAGQDLGQALRGEFARTIDRGWFGIVDRPPKKPLIVAVEGFALAGGLEIALVGDIVVSGRSALFGVPEVRNGQVAAARGLTRLPLRLPYALASKMALTGDPVSAEVMHQHGLVSDIVDDGSALQAAIEIAQRIAANPPEAVRITLTALRDTVALTESAAWALQAQALSVYALASTPEYQEGVTAFLEKRPPRWP